MMKRISQIGMAGLSAVALTMTLGTSAPAKAAFPEKPVTIMVAYAPGGGTDVTVRALVDIMSQKLGQSVLVQNVSGAGGGVAAARLAKSKPDGYTVMATNSVSITLEPLVKKTLYDLEDFVTVAMIGEFQGAVFANKDKPFSSLDDLAGFAKKEGRAIKFASFLSVDRLVMQYVGKQKGFEVIPVPVKGGSGAVQAVLAGDVDVAWSGGSWAPIVAAGDAKALFATSYGPLRMAPDLVSMKGLGFPFGTTAYVPLMAPKGTPPEVLKILADALKPAVESDFAQGVGKKRNIDLTFRDTKTANEIMKNEREAYVKIQKSIQ